MKIAIVSVLAAISPLVSSAEVRSTGFSSLMQAQQEFRTNENASVRHEAYEFAKKYMMRNKHLSTGSAALSAVRLMADSLGCSQEADTACRDMLSSSNESVRVAAATMLCDMIRKSDCPESETKLRKAMKEFGPDKQLRSIALMKIADTCLSSQRMVAAEEAADEILALGAEANQAAYLSACYIKMDHAASKKDFSSVEKTLLSMLSLRDDVPAGMSARLVKTKMPAERILNVVEAIRHRVAEAAISNDPRFQTVAESAGIEVAVLLRAAGRIEESLSECRVLTSLSGSSGYRNAVLAAAESLKALDGDLRRVRECMDFHQKGVVPKSKNVLLSFPPLRDPARVELVKALDAREGESWKDLLEKSKFYLWADEPQKALKSALDAFSLAPIANNDLQMCANAAMRPILAFSRDPQRGKNVASYLLFGSAGPDASEGTRDDIISPQADLQAYMKFCGYPIEGANQ